MHLCLFTPTFLPKIGGAETAIDAIARALVARGHEVTVLAQVASKEQTLTLDAAMLPYRVVRFARPFSRGFGAPLVAHHLTRLHRKHPIDAVEAHFLYYTGWIAVRWALKRGVPVAVMCHGDDLQRDGRYQRRRLTNSRIIETVQRSPALIAISGVVEKRLLEIDPGCGARIHRVPLMQPPGLVPAAVAGLPPTGSFIACVSRLAPGKGADSLLGAYDASKLSARGVKLVIAGDGPEGERIRAHAAKVDGVVLTGSLTQAQCATVYRDARFCVFPSTLPETFGAGLLEALSHGTPVLASTTAAYLEVLESCPIARHYTPNDDDSFLVPALTQCAHDWEKRPISPRLQTYLKRFEPGEVARLHEEALLGQRG